MNDVFQESVCVGGGKGGKGKKNESHMGMC